MALSHCRIEEVRHILSLMHKNLECPICLELMKEPVSTKCDHQFCRYCMLKLLGKKRRGIGQCPLCKLEVTKRSLRESSRFKLLVEGVQKAIRAFELDTGIELAGASCLPKTSVKPAFNENLHNDIDVVQSKGYTSRQKNVTSKAGSEHCTVECHISARLTEPVVAKHSEQNREKTVEPVGSVFIEFGSDESSDEQLFKWKPDDRSENEDGLIQILPQEEEAKEKNLTDDDKPSRLDDEHTEGSDESVPFANDEYFEEDSGQEGKEDCSFGLNSEVKTDCFISDGSHICSGSLHPDLNTSSKIVFNEKSSGTEISYSVTDANQDIEKVFISKSSKEAIRDWVAYKLEDAQHKCDKDKRNEDLGSENQKESTNQELQASLKPCDNESVDVSKTRLRRSIEKVSEWLSRSADGLQTSGDEASSQQKSITLGQDANYEEVSVAIPWVPDVTGICQFHDTGAQSEHNRSSEKLSNCTVQEKIFGKTYKREKKQSGQLNLNFTSENRSDVSVAKTTENTKVDRTDTKKKRKRSSGLQPEDFIKRDCNKRINDQPVVNDAESVNPLVIKNTEAGCDVGTDKDFNCKTGDITNENLLSNVTGNEGTSSAAVDFDYSAQNIVVAMEQESDKQKSKVIRKCSPKMSLHLVAEKDLGDLHQAEVSGSPIMSHSVVTVEQVHSYLTSEEQTVETVELKKTRQSRKCSVLTESERTYSRSVTGLNILPHVSFEHSEKAFSVRENEHEKVIDFESLEPSCKNEQITIHTEIETLSKMNHSGLELPRTMFSLSSNMFVDNSEENFTLKHQAYNNSCNVLQEHAVVQHSSQSNHETVVISSFVSSDHVQQESLSHTMCIEKSEYVAQGNCDEKRASMVKDATAENEDSEVDTEHLLQSFRISKRKSFILHHSPIPSFSVQESMLQKSCNPENSKSEIFEGEMVVCSSNKFENSHSIDLNNENSTNCQVQKIEENAANGAVNSESLQVHSDDTNISCNEIPFEEKCMADSVCGLPLVVQQISPVSERKKTKCSEDSEKQKQKRFKINSSVVLVNYSLSQDSSTSDSVSEGVSEQHQVPKANCEVINMPGSLKRICDNQEAGLPVNSLPESMPLFSVTSQINQASIYQASAECELHKSKHNESLKQNGILQVGTCFGSKEILPDAKNTGLNAVINGTTEEYLLEDTDDKRQTSKSFIPLTPDSLTSTVKLSGTNCSQDSSTSPSCSLMKDFQLNEGQQSDNTGKRSNSSEMISEGKNILFCKSTECLREGDVSSSASQSMIQYRKRSAQKLDSSESNSSDDELPCFQVVFSSNSKSKRSTENTTEALKELSTNSDLDREITSSQCSEHSVDLFSPGYEEAFPKPHMEGTLSTYDKQEQTVCSIKIIAQESQNQKPNGICEHKMEEEFPKKYEVPANHSEGANRDTDKGETSGCESEASHTGDSSGFSSQSDILTTQQREAIQKNIEKLEQEMAVLEAVLEEHETQAGPSFSPSRNGSSLSHGPEREMVNLQMDCLSVKNYIPDQQEHHKVEATFHGRQITQECVDRSKLKLTMACPRSPTPPSTPSYSQLKRDKTPEKVRAALSILEELKANIKSQEDGASCLSMMPDGEILEQSCPWTHKTGENAEAVENEPCSSTGNTQMSKDASWRLQANKGLETETTPRQSAKGLLLKRSPFLLLPPPSSKTGNSKSPVVTSRRKMSLVASGLGKNELLLVQKFSRKLQCSFSSQITNETTHVIMKTDEELVCERTLKYFLGIAGRKWIIGFQWVVESFKQGRILDECNFEVRGDIVNGRNHGGPRRAREIADGELLLKDYEICCYGPFTDMRSDQLEWLVELCGAIVVKEPYLFSYSPSHTSLVLVQPDAATGVTDYKALQRKYGASVVTREWVLDSVACYQCQNWHDYMVCPK